MSGNIKIIFILIAGISILNSCTSEISQSDKVIAKVHSAYLYERDLEEMFPKLETGLNVDDSIMLRNSYIKNWIQNRLIFHKALQSLSNEQKNKDRELEQYYHSLIRYEYEKELVHQLLDSNISEREINQFYKTNIEKFDLKRNIVRIIYIKLPENAPDLNKVRLLYVSGAVEDFDDLHKYSVQNALEYSLYDTDWVYFDEVLKTLPLQVNNQEEFLKNTGNIEINHNGSIYLINILDFRLINQRSPVELEKNLIKNIILNKRKAAIVRELEKKVMRDGIENNHYQIY